MTRNERAAARRWARLQKKLTALAEEYGRMPPDSSAMHFAAMHSTLGCIARLAELHCADGAGWTTLMVCTPPDRARTSTRLSITVIGSAPRPRDRRDHADPEASFEELAAMSRPDAVPLRGSR
jgi:hypothetical protein